MINALDINNLKNAATEKYNHNEERIVGIMFARYDLPLTKEIVSSCYLYWNYNTEDILDIFWAGYGEYLCPDNQSSDKIILDFIGNERRVYYDRKAFVSIKNEFNDIFRKPYQDRLQLILVNYRKGELHFNESIKIDLEENLDSNFATIRELMEYITNECIETYDVADLARKLRGEKIKDYIRKQVEGITLSDVIETSLSIVSLK